MLIRIAARMASSPYLLYVNPIQSVCRLEMPTLSSSNHCPNAWHRFWLNDREVCVWCASECVRLVPNYSLPARGWCRMLLSVHPEEMKKWMKKSSHGKDFEGKLTRIAFFNVSASCLKASNSFIFTWNKKNRWSLIENNVEFLSFVVILAKYCMT